jgi:hypothetical protein
MAFLPVALMAATTSRVVTGLLGLALVGLAAISYKWVSPTIGGPWFDRHPNLKSFQRLVPPALIAIVGLGVVAFALAG